MGVENSEAVIKQTYSGFCSFEEILVGSLHSFETYLHRENEKTEHVFAKIPPHGGSLPSRHIRHSNRGAPLTQNSGLGYIVVSSLIVMQLP